MLGAFRQQRDALVEEHQEINAQYASPWIDYFENYYRRKLAAGELTLQQIFEKIDSATNPPVTDVLQVNVGGQVYEVSVKDHLKRHIGLVPPTAEDIEEAVKDAQERERKRREKESQDLDALAKEARRLEDRERRQRQGQTLIEQGRIVRGQHTIVFAKNTQLYVFRKGHRGRLKTTRYYKALQRVAREALRLSRSQQREEVGRFE